VFNIPKRTTINLRWGTLGPIRKFNHEIAKLEAPDATRCAAAQSDWIIHEKKYNNQLGAWSIGGGGDDCFVGIGRKDVSSVRRM